VNYSSEKAGYRPDVDGLRALAVLTVILCHAGLGCPGGFVGVDVFFVISGFLITSLLSREISEGQFSLVAFWERRIRRIFPTIFVVVLATLIAGWFLYLPEDFLTLGKSALAQTVLLANVFFFRKTGYFEDAADTHPLLHTWSLAVEEQFYLLFPLLLFFLTRCGRKSLVGGIAFLGVGSFALSVVGSYSHPAATFYLLPSRAWELMMGALLAVLPDGRKPTRWLNEAAGLAGLGLILFSVFTYTSLTRFPGVAALPPCLGAALIIFSGRSKITLVGRGLVWRPLVFIGLISGNTAAGPPRFGSRAPPG
jgi:peptidoglycan/LPS O-acetylase OafA/YrhL